MPNGDTVQVQTPNGQIWTIPKQNLAQAQQRGAKIYTPKPASKPGFGTGLAESFGYDPKNPVSGTLKNLASPILHPIQTGKYLVGEAEKQTPEGVGRAVIASLPYLAKGEYGHAAEEFSGKITPLVGGGLETMARGETARGAGQLTGSIAQLAMAAKAPELPRIAEDPEALLAKSKDLASRAGQAIVNEGPSKERMQLLQESDALHTKSKLAALEKSVKDDQSNLQQKVSTAVDTALPEGSVDLTKVGSQLKEDLKQYVKAKSLRAKLPGSVQKILDESGGTTTKPTAMRLTQNELRTANALYREGIKGDDLRSGLSNLGYTPKQVDAMMQSVEGVEGGQTLGKFEQAKQLRTELADELFTGGADRYPGGVRKAMFNAWRNLTTELDSAADKAKVGEDWQRAKEKSTQYYHNFHGTYDRGKFNQSPIGSSLSGVVSRDIMEPLSGKTAQQTRDILNQYRQFGVDPKEILGDVRRFNRNEKIMKFASPSKWDILMAAYALYRPEYGIPMFIARYGAPRLAELMASARAKGMEGARAASEVVPEK